MHIGAALVAVVLAVGAAAQPAPMAGASAFVLVSGATSGVRLQSGDESRDGRGRSLPFSDLAAGRWQVHFGAGTSGRPESVTVALEPGAIARIAVAAPGPPPDPPSPDPCSSLVDWQDGSGADAARRWRADGTLQCRVSSSYDALLRPPAGPDGRISVRISSRTGPVGILARWTGPGDHYLAGWDGARVILERQVGGQRTVLGEHAVTARADVPHELSLQVSGFRIAVWFDDAPLLQVLDGAHVDGRCGLWAAPAASAQFADFQVHPPADPLPVLAVVTGERRCEVQAAFPAVAGGRYALALWLDRPHGPVLGDVGAEPFLLQRAAAPVFLIGGGSDWRSALGDLDGAGRLRASWPRHHLPSLRGQVALVGGFVLTPDGREVAGLLPRAATAL